METVSNNIAICIPVSRCIRGLTIRPVSLFSVSLFCFFALLACTQDTYKFTVEVDSLTAYHAYIIWSPVAGTQYDIEMIGGFAGLEVYKYPGIIYLYQLTANTRYEGSIVAYDANGIKTRSMFSFQTPENHLPSQVQMTVESITINSANIKWIPSIDLDGDVIEYEIYFNDSLVEKYTDLDFSDRTTPRYRQFNNLTPNASYTLRFETRDTEGLQISEIFFKTLFDHVYHGDLILNLQKDIDTFLYTDVSGKLLITGPEITSLAGLSGLKSVERVIEISGTNLTTLRGLDRVMIIFQNELQSDLSRELVIRDNPNLTEIPLMRNFGACGVIQIDYNPQLINLDGLNYLEKLNTGRNGPVSLRITNNQSLQNINGLSNLVQIREGEIVIINNDNLVNLDGLAGLGAPGSLSQLEVTNNDSLVDSCGIKNIVTAQEFEERQWIYNVMGNAFDPTTEDVISGTCMK
jgi:hypothetical protein